MLNNLFNPNASSKQTSVLAAEQLSRIDMNLKKSLEADKLNPDRNKENDIPVNQDDVLKEKDLK